MSEPKAAPEEQEVPKKKGPHNPNEINPKLASDIHYWAEEFHVTGQNPGSGHRRPSKLRVRSNCASWREAAAKPVEAARREAAAKPQMVNAAMARSKPTRLARGTNAVALPAWDRARIARLEARSSTMPALTSWARGYAPREAFVLRQFWVGHP